jgi:sugar lactone lactonase YvrE
MAEASQMHPIDGGLAWLDDRSGRQRQREARFAPAEFANLSYVSTNAQPPKSVSLKFMNSKHSPLLHLSLIALSLCGNPVSSAPESTKSAPAFPRGAVSIKRIAYFPDRQATGVAVSRAGRIFLSLPRLIDDVPVAVGELVEGEIKPYPDLAWNGYRMANAANNNPASQFVCAQAVVMDRQDHLWIVDPATPRGSGPVSGGSKLIEIDVNTNQVIRVLPFASDATPPGSSINDVRFSPKGDFAYLSNVGEPGSLVVMNLRTGHSWRVLAGDPSTQYDKSVTQYFKGKPMVRVDGKPFHLNADGIELSVDGKTFYWQAFTGKTVYSIPTVVLQDPKLAATAQATPAATTHPADGLWIDAAGRFFVTNPAENSIEIADHVGAQLTLLIKDDTMHWPDSFAQAADGSLYITASFIGDSPWFDLHATTTPSAVFRISSP